MKNARRGDQLKLIISVILAALAVLATGLGISARSAQTEAEKLRTDAEGLMSYMLGEFVGKLRPLGRLDLLDSVSTRTLAYLSDARRSGESNTDVNQRVKSLQLISEVKIARGDPEQANIALQQARTILGKQLDLSPSDKQLLKSAGENAFWLGQIQLDQSNWPEAQQHFEAYLVYANRQAALSPSEPGSWIEQSYAHNNLGTLALRRGDILQASKEFALSAQLKRRAYQVTPDDKQLAADLADTLSWQASAVAQSGSLDQAGQLRADELSLLQRLSSMHPDESLWKYRMALAMAAQSELKQAMGDMIASHASARNARDLLQAIVSSDATNRKWQRDLYVAELRLVETMPTSNPSTAVSQLELLERKFTELNELEPKKINLQIMIAQARYYRALNHFKAGKPEQAITTNKQTLASLQALAKQFPSNKKLLITWANAALLESGLDSHESANAQPATSKCNDAIKVLAPLVKASRDYRVLAPWVMANACIGNHTETLPIRQQLESIGFRDPRYTDFLSTHPPMKVQS